MKTFFRLLRVSCIMIYCLVSSAVATTLQDVVKDMQPLEAFVVEVVHGQIIFGLGSGDGILKNDLFTVFREGQKLTDPRTGKELGRIETSAGMVAVTRVEKQFSYARPVGETGEIKRGDKLVRFKEISAFLQDSAATKGTFSFELQRGLQALNWQNSKKGAELVFSHNNDELTVTDRQGSVVRQYQLGDTPQEAAVNSSKPTYAPIYDAGGSADGAIAGGAAGIQGNKKIKYDMETYGYTQGGALPFSVVMGDFLMIGSQMYIAVIREYQVVVYKVVDQSMVQVASIKTPLVKLLSVCWWQPGQGQYYLGVTGYDKDEEQVSSMIYAFHKDQMKPVLEELPYILGGNDLDGDSQPETMLAQSFDQDIFFGRTFKQAQIAGNSIKFSAYKGALPATYSVVSGTVLDDGQTAAYIAGNKLHIASGGREVYRSGKEMGGSVSSVLYEVNPDDINPLFSSAKIELSPLGVDIDGDGNRELLIPSADLSGLTTLGGINNIKKSWVSVFKKNGNGTYMKGKIGGEYDQSIQAMGTGDGALYLLTVNPEGLFSGNQGRSQLLVLPFKD